MIPASHILFNDDGTAWWLVGSITAPFGEPLPAALDRPCDTCDGARHDRALAPCPDCDDGSGRHTFTVEVEGEWEPRMLTDRTFRVSVVPDMVLPITFRDDRDGNGIVPSTMAPGEWWVWMGGQLSDYPITLPPAAKPGMYAVKLEVHQ